MEARYIPFDKLTQQVLHGLAESTRKAGVGEVALAYKLAAGEVKVFVLHGGSSPVYFAVSVIQRQGERVLMLDGLWVERFGTGRSWKTWLLFLAKLAKEWGCVAVETAVTNHRQLPILQRLGLTIEHSARMEITDD